LVRKEREMTEEVRHVLGVFAKWPAADAVKTRLAAATSPAWAARVAAAFLHDTLDRLAATAARRFLAYTPEAAGAEFHRLAGGRYEAVPQGGGDLGARLGRFFAARFAEGAAAVVVVGADSPTLPPDRVARALAELSRCDVVLGPAADGGYYLLGLGRDLPGLFAGIDWGGPHVLRQTVGRLPDDARLALLPPWYDVDSPDDWHALAGHLAALRRAGADPGAPRTEALVLEGWG
jgi:rSAM/selenodomain-associated transferase 1